MKKNISIFIDFDGTITQSDVGDEMFKHFASIEPYNTQLKNGEMTIHKYWKKICSLMPSELNIQDVYKFIDTMEIDPYFIKFVDYAYDNNFNITILSDGFDLYIDRILANNNLSHIKYYSNKLNIIDGQFIPEFTGASESCSCFCASCKRNKLINLSNDDDIIVYIGDGYSDFCGARHSDIIFAKKSLAAYCNKERIPHYPFKSFFDVKRIMKDFISKNKYKKRNNSKMNIKRALEWE